MSNNIPIDDLFREKLSGGKEQLNLGAWANMERMLNGQNPYANAEQEPKRKRRILPFMIIFILLTAAVSAGFLWLNKKDNIAQDLSQPNNNISVVNNNQPEVKPPSVNADNSNTSNQITPNQITPNQINSTPESDQTQTAQQAGYVRKAGRRTKHAVPNGQTTNSSPNDAAKSNFAGTNDLGTGEPDETAIASSNPGPEFSMGNKFSDNGNKKARSARNSMKVAGNAANSTEDVKKQRSTVKINQTVAQLKVTKNRNGSIKSEYYDTIGRYEIEKQVKEKEMNAIANNTPKDKNYKYHPRYVVGAEQYTADPLLSSPLAYAAANELKTPAMQTAPDEKSKQSKKEKANVFGAIGAFTGATLAKIGESGGDFLRMFSVLDPGISLGVNAALFNTKNNYGGFHGGLTNHTAISETFSIMSELKFFLRNNAGFTINDIQTLIKTPAMDTVTLPGYTKYSWQVDSSTRRYNFKNFMSLELPVMLSARFNNLSVYGGPNFVYNMKIKVNEINRNYAPRPSDTFSVTVLKNTPFNYPAEKSLQYVRSDFGSRFGIGYVVGVSYNFNPKIYLDLRLSKVVWDNTKTNTQREISNGVTKVPFTQLSFGYKFKNK